MSRIGRKFAQDTYPQAPRPIMVIGGRVKQLVSGVPVPLLQIDILTTQDNTFAARLQFAAECSDGTDAQIRQGDCNSAVAFKPPATFATRGRQQGPSPRSTLP